MYIDINTLFTFEVSKSDDQSILAAIVLCRPKNFDRQLTKKYCNPYFIVIMITVLTINVIFWVVNLKTQNYFVISTTQNV
jgi:hypothetical protein